MVNDQRCSNLCTGLHLESEWANGATIDFLLPSRRLNPAQREVIASGQACPISYRISSCKNGQIPCEIQHGCPVILTVFHMLAGPGGPQEINTIFPQRERCPKTVRRGIQTPAPALLASAKANGAHFEPESFCRPATVTALCHSNKAKKRGPTRDICNQR